MRIIYLGNNQRGITCLESLVKSHHEVVLAVAQTGEEQGWYQSIDEKARELDIPIEISNKPNSPEFLKKIREDKPDLAVMCGYSRIVGREFLDIPKYGAINLHASKLPFYRGAAPLNWALINGEREIGLSIYQVDEGIDTGPIYAQRTFEVKEDDTIKNVLDKTLEIYPLLLIEVCDGIEKGSLKPIPQDLEQGTYFTKRHPKDGKLNFENMTASEIHNKVRALTHPYPGAFFVFEGKKYFIWESGKENRDYHGIPGRIGARHEDGVTVIAKDRGIRLKRVQKESEEETEAQKIFKRTGLDLIDKKNE